MHAMICLAQFSHAMYLLHAFKLLEIDTLEDVPTAEKFGFIHG